MKAFAFFVFSFFFIGSLSQGIHAQGQQHHNIFSLFLSPYRQAEKLYKQNDFMSAIVWYEKALQKKGHHQNQIRHRLATCYRLTHHTKEAEIWYKDIMNNKSIIGPEDVIHYAQILLSNQKYDASKAWFEYYLNEYGADTLVSNKLKGIQQLQTFYADSTNTPVKRLSINTSFAEFCPVFYENGILFTSSRLTPSVVRLHNNKDNRSFLDLYYSEYNKDSSLDTPKPWHPNVNGSFHEGPIVFFDSCHQAILTKSIHRDISSNSSNGRHLGLFELKKTERKGWTAGEPLPFNNRNYSVAHAAISENGEWLYFSSNKPGGFGGADLYKAHREGEKWSEAENLGPVINTSGNELFPTLLEDSILFFASNGHPGIGGLDIYQSTFFDSTFSIPENLGYPINSNQDDFGFIYSQEKRKGYFSSNRMNLGTDDDLYTFDLIRIFLKGNIRSKLKNTLLDNVTVSLLLNGKEIIAKTCDTKGSFLFTLDPGEEYVMKANKPGYKEFVQSISSRHHLADDTIGLEILLEKEVKTLVKGVVYQNGSVMTDLAVVAMETATLHRDTLWSDDRGEFFFEADPDLEYYLYVDNRHSFGEVLLEASKKTKGTFLLYAKIELHPYDTSFVNVTVKHKGLPISRALVAVQNVVTGKQDTVYTNKKGVARFVVKSYSNYTFTAQNNGLKSSPYTYKSNRSSRHIELLLKEEE